MNKMYCTLICCSSVMGDSSCTQVCLAGSTEGVADGASETVDCSLSGTCCLGGWKALESQLSSWLKDGLRPIS